VADSIASLLDIVFGYGSDRLGKRKEFAVAGYGISTILKAGLFFATAWQHVLMIRGAERVGKSLRTPARDAIIAASTDEKTRGKAFGFHRGMDTLGAIAGPIVAYLVFRAMGETESAFRTIFLIAIIPALLAVVAIAFLVREPKTKGAPGPAERPRFWQSLRMLSPFYKRFLAVSCLFSLAYFSFGLLILRAGDIGLGPQDALLAYVLFNIVYAVASVPVGSLSDRLGRKPVIAFSFMLYALICAGFIAASELWHVAALFALYGVFVAADESVNKAYISDMTDDKNRGIALGAYNSAVGAVYLPANAAFGLVWAVFGVPAAFGAAALVAAVAGFLMLMQR
jgi:MFS family permease